MRKKCVRWSKCVRNLVAVVAVISGAAASPVAQSNDPSTLPRLNFNDLSYIGGFRLPSSMSNGDSFSIGGKQLAFNPAGPSLFVGSRAGRVAEVSIPTPVNSTNPDALPFAQFLQPLTDPTEGHLSEVGTEGVSLDSLLVYNNRLYGTASTYYDGNNIQRISHYSHSLQLNQPSFSGWSSVWQAEKTGFVSGVLALVPQQWQAALGGQMITGQCCLPVVTRTSWGPAAFAFDPSRIASGALVPASPLLYYTGEHPTLGVWEASSEVYGASTTLGGMVIVPGTRTALYFGANGIGPNCYGDGTADASLAGTKAPDGSTYCYDPTSNAKGTHSYPYRYQIWAYDLNDFAAVKAGRKQPWEVTPYGVWPFDLPTKEDNVRLGGAAYDPATQRIYLSQLYADRDGYGYRALIHALGVGVAPTAAATVSSVSIMSDLPAPQSPGTPIKFAATPAGGTAPYDYRWFLSDGTSTSYLSGWQSSHEFTWTTSSGNANYRIGVQVRSGGRTTDAPEATADIAFPITTTTTRTSAVTLAANKTSPQAAGTSILWTATPIGGTAPHQYLWWVYDGAWNQVGQWATSNTFTWTPSIANSNYRIAVWVRSSGNQTDHDAATEAYFSITEAATAAGPSPVPTPTGSASPVTGISLGADRVSPQPANTTINWTATAIGGVSPVYQFWVFDGTTWTPYPWSSSNKFAWTPTSANSNYRVAVWAKSDGAADKQVSTEAWFSITAAQAAAGPVTSVKLTSDLTSPQRFKTVVTWTAVASGGVAPLQYQWWTFDGANWESGPWTTSNTFKWTPSKPNTTYRVAVWVRSANNTTGSESSTESWFVTTAK